MWYLFSTNANYINSNTNSTVGQSAYVNVTTDYPSVRKVAIGCPHAHWGKFSRQSLKNSPKTPEKVAFLEKLVRGVWKLNLVTKLVTLFYKATSSNKTTANPN